MKSNYLVRDLWVVLSGHSFSNCRFHETREGGKYVDGRVDLLVVQLTFNEDLSFCDVTSEIWDWVGNIVIRHGEDGDLGDGPISALDSTGSLVDGGEICIEVTRI